MNNAELKVALAATDAMSSVLRRAGGNLTVSEAAALAEEAIRQNNEEMDELHRLSELALKLGAETAFTPEIVWRVAPSRT